MKMKIDNLLEEKQLKVFLGGTVNGSTWREELKKLLKINYFDPVVPKWDDKAYHQELKERKNCDFCLYVISPKMIGVYSIAEAVDDSNKRPHKTVFAYMEVDGKDKFDENQIRSLDKVSEMIRKNKGKTFKIEKNDFA